MDSLTQQQKVIIGVLAVVVFCAIIAGIAIVVYTFQQIQSTPEMAPSATTVSTDTVAPTDTTIPTDTSTPEPIDEVWANIEASGKIRVGMSADYPPYAYIDENYTIQGYDLALMQEISQRLGYPLDIRNMAFDGLFDALQLNEIDVAVAAISRTNERDKFVDFSTVYFVGEDAILARMDSTIVIEEVEDLAAYRIGVQKGSVYETLIQDTLIDTGKMRPQNLLSFGKPVEAIEAMLQSNPTVDLVLLDLQPAEVAIRAMEVKIIAHGLLAQYYALAIPSEALVLQSRLNGALQQMQNDGTLARLALEYLDVDTLLPLPTPAPTQPPETPTACLDSLRVIQDLNYPDFNMTQPPQFGPGFTFQKGWRIQNTGTCTWDSNYRLTYRGSNPPNVPVGGNPVPVVGTVAPGQAYDIYVTITTPSQPGIYQSFWTMRAPSGLFFGDVLYAGFEVVVQQTATPQPDEPKIYSYVVTPSRIPEGGCVDITWSYGGQDITRSRVFRNDEVILFDIPPNGSFVDCPPGTGNMEYLLRIDSADAGSAVARRFVEVEPGIQPTNTTGPSVPTNTPEPGFTPEPTAPVPTETEEPTAPVIINFVANPDEIPLGESVTLSWVYESSLPGDANLYRGEEQIVTDLAPSGEFSDTPQEAGQIIYRLVVISDAGEAYAEIPVNVVLVIPQSSLELAWQNLWSMLVGERID